MVRNFYIFNFVNYGNIEELWFNIWTFLIFLFLSLKEQVNIPVQLVFVCYT